MSRITKMKYVAAETTLDYSLPEHNQTICKIIQNLGNCLFKVETPEGGETIASMPPKFRRHVYVKRSSFVVTEPIPEGKKVKAEIVRILQRNIIKHFHQEGVWPAAFEKNNYLDNTFSSAANYRLTDKSDRGFIHGEKYYHQASGKAFKKPKAGTALNVAYEEDSDDDRPYIEPNFNKKAVSRFIFLDDEDSEDEESDS